MPTLEEAGVAGSSSFSGLAERSPNLHERILPMPASFRLKILFLEKGRLFNQ
jgi:hypothetical protein